MIKEVITTAYIFDSLGKLVKEAPLSHAVKLVTTGKARMASLNSNEPFAVVLNEAPKMLKKVLKPFYVKEREEAKGFNPKLHIRHQRVSVIKAEMRRIVGVVNSKAVLKENKNGYLFLTKKDNKEIFEALRGVGFFDFHVTNGGGLVYLHQVHLYCKANKGGWQLYCQGQVCRKDELEVHHINHDVKDCSPENLAYVSPAENKFLAECVLGGKYFGKAFKIPVGIMLKCKDFLSLRNRTVRETLLRWLPDLITRSVTKAV